MNNQIVVKYKKGKLRLEIVCNKDYIKEYKSVESKDNKLKILNKLIVTDSVFSNYSKATLACSSEIKSICNTDNLKEVYIFILDNGEIPISSAERKKITEQKRLEIINLIHTNYLSPIGKKPHPVSRIDAALKSIKGFVVDLHKPIENQVRDIMKKLSNVLPLIKNTITTTVTLTHAQLGTGINILKQYSTILSENYHAGGATFEIDTNKNDYEHIVKYLGYDKKEEVTNKNANDKNDNDIDIDNKNKNKKKYNERNKNKWKKTRKNKIKN
jgi:ribosome maturation protein SDO1